MSTCARDYRHDERQSKEAWLAYMLASQIDVSYRNSTPSFTERTKASADVSSKKEKKNIGVGEWLQRETTELLPLQLNHS